VTFRLALDFFHRTIISKSVKTKVCIVEDNAGTRVNLMKVLQGAPELTCQHGYPDGETALREIPIHVPDVVLMDIRLPSMSGIECVARLKEKIPDLVVLMLTTYEESDLIFDSLRAGATGYLLKNMPPAELVNAVVQARTGGSPLSMRIARKIVGHFQEIKKPASETDGLTKREHEILSLLAKGFLYKEIADQLQISINTVRVHVQKVYEKLHVHSRSQAIMRFLGK
jgi:DNA-binding NarL/FixJ family response regulator